MRPLVMDFPTAGAVTAVDDQYMFGPALMVSPVTAYKVRERDGLFPPTPGGWYDFWTGAAPARARRQSPAPFDAIPVHVRAGAIVPFGPELQYTDEQPADPITLVVYAGSDGAFTLYEDDGVSHDYERGAWATIPLRWHEANRTLTIGQREGSSRACSRGARSRWCGDEGEAGAVLVHAPARQGRHLLGRRGDREARGSAPQRAAARASAGESG